MRHAPTVRGSGPGAGAKPTGGATSGPRVLAEMRARLSSMSIPEDSDECSDCGEGLSFVSMASQEFTSSTLVTAWSSAVWAGKKGEDRVVATWRPWPAGDEGAEVQPPSGPRRSASLGSSTGGLGTAWRQAMAGYHLFAVFDGHNGAEAARFAAHSVVDIVDAFLPAWGHHLGPAAFPADPAELAEQLQEALVLACLELDRQFAMTGCTAGCTATLALQVGCLLTVASLGSSRCMLHTGSGSALELSADHRISRSPAERQRLVAAGCHVAAQEVGGCGPAPVHSKGTGVLRLWPGGLTLSRSVGDFAIGEAVLALPHVKQVMLPPSGGRLVLASDGVWSLASDALLRAMHDAALKTAAHEVVKCISTGRHSKVDASVVVVDMLPAGDTFQALCKRLEPEGAAPGTDGRSLKRSASSGAKMLQLLGLGKKKSSWTEEESRAQQATQAPAAASQLAAEGMIVADFDSAALVGLVPLVVASQAGSKASSRAASPHVSRQSSVGLRAGSLAMATHKALAGAAAAAAMAAASPGDEEAAGRHPAAAEGAMAQLPAWFDAEVEAQMLATMVETQQLWHLARRRRKAAQAAAAEEEMERRGSYSDSDLLWLEQAAAAGDMLYDRGLAPRSCGSNHTDGPDWLLPSAHASPFAAAAAAAPPPSPAPLQQPQRQPGLSAQAPLVLRSHSLSRLPSDAASPGLRRQASLQPATPSSVQDLAVGAAGARSGEGSEEDAASDSGQTVLSCTSTLAQYRGGQAQAALAAGAGRPASLAPAGTDELLTPLRRLPPLITPRGEPAQQPGTAVPARGAVLRSSTVVLRSSGGMPGGATPGSSRPPLPRSKSSVAAMLSGGGSRRMEPLTPHAAQEIVRPTAHRQRHAARQPAGSPNTLWVAGYSSMAGMFTKAGSGSMRRTSSNVG